MEREQIIKALECCANGGSCYTLDCPNFRREESAISCTKRLAKNALSLINELTEEKEDLARRLVTIHDMAVKKERELTEENERLREKADRNLNNLKAVLEERCENTIVADTVRKLQERLKAYEHRMCCNFCKHSLRGKRNEKCDEELQCFGWNKWESLIDQIAKEMLEGEK